MTHTADKKIECRHSEKVFDWYINGEIGNQKCKELLGWPQQSQVINHAEFKRYIASKGIKKVHNIVDKAGSIRTHGLREGEDVGTIRYLDGRREVIAYKDTGKNDIEYKRRARHTVSQKFLKIKRHLPGGNQMTLNEYQELAARTINPNLSVSDMSMHALHEMVGEIGELHSLYQKQYQGHPFDNEHAMKETGDILWGIAEYCTAMGWPLEAVCQMNIDKLRARYPDGFSVEKSEHRAKGDI